MKFFIRNDEITDFRSIAEIPVVPRFNVAATNLITTHDFVASA